MNLTAFVAGLPKAELHVHHVGSASPRIVAALAERHPGTVPSDPDALRDFFTFRDFAHFIEVYLTVAALVRDAEDVRMLTYEVAVDMAGQNIRYAELTCTPYTTVHDASVPIEAYVEAIEDARVAAERDHGIRMRWIYDVPGEFGVPSAEETVGYIPHSPSTLIGFGLGGPEIGWPRPQFKPAFDQARAHGLHSVPHAGETTGPQTIWDSLEDLGAERIGHGTSAVQDEQLMQHLVENRIPLEVCPTSNLATGVVASLEEHPIRQMQAAGAVVTVNSDDPPMFGTTLNREYEIAANLLGLDALGVAELAKTAVRAAFLDAAELRALLEEIDRYAATHA